MMLLSDCKGIAGGSFGKFGPTCAYGFWARRLVIAIPTAKSRHDPAQPIEPNDLLSGGKFVALTRNGQHGQKAPSDPFFFRGRVGLVHLHIGEHHRLGICRRATVTRFADAHASRLHSHPRDASALARSLRRNKNVHGTKFAPIRRRLEQSLIIGEFAVLCSTYNKFYLFRT